MTEIYREFVLRGRADWQEVVATVKAAAPTMASDNRPLRVILVDGSADRLDSQVEYYWHAVIEPIAEQLVIDGRQFGPKTWHKKMKEMFLPPVEIRQPDGSIKLVEGSIARGQISVGAMSKYILKVEAHVASAYGVQFD